MQESARSRGMFGNARERQTESKSLTELKDRVNALETAVRDQAEAVNQVVAQSKDEGRRQREALDARLGRIEEALKVLSDAHRGDRARPAEFSA